MSFVITKDVLRSTVKFERIKKSRITRDFVKALREGLNNWKNRSVDYSKPYSHPIDRLIWWLVHTTAVLGMLFMIVDATLEFLSGPTVTAGESSNYPMQKIDYPAVAICDVNRISRKAAWDLAEQLFELENTTYGVNFTVEEVAHSLRLLGNLYLYELYDDDLEKMKRLHAILRKSYYGYDITRIMKRLTPKCRSMLVRCSWNGQDSICDDMFSLRKTDGGFCCVFNYVRHLDNYRQSPTDIYASRVKRSTNVGPKYGLSVLLDPHLEDYAYTILPTRGFKISVYRGMDYPDHGSGGIRDVLVSPRTETFLNLNAVTFYTTSEVKEYDVSMRDCLFNTEQTEKFQGYYSFRDCVMHCRVRDILQICGCIPFFYPLAGAAKTCDLKDLPCLRNYKGRWWNLKPRTENIMEPFDDEGYQVKTGYLSCDCLPSCEDTEYRISTSSIPLSVSELHWDRTRIRIRNHTVVHVFFGKSRTVRLKQDVVFYWYELMSNYGGICSLFLGISMVNVVEAVYLLILRFCQRDKEKQFHKVDVCKKSVNVTTPIVRCDISNVRELYWREITGSLKNPGNSSKLTKIG